MIIKQIYNLYIYNEILCNEIEKCISLIILIEVNKKIQVNIIDPR